MSASPARPLRIIYGCPIGDNPSGGVKVIYRHSELLSRMGQPSLIWHPGHPEFRCSWFEQNVQTIADADLNPATDFIILPEIWATVYVPLLKNLGFKVGIFVQNAYYTHVNLNPQNPNAIREAYQGADLILSISADTSLYLEDIFQVPAHKIVLQRYSLDANLFRPGTKSKTLTYMPRKMAQHSARVVSALQPLLGADWQIIPLDGMNERQVAQHLSQSIVFMAFSEFEGLPVPPVEAAMCGNIVIGYHGQGGKEYWHTPNFIEVEQGDVQGFVFEVLDCIREIESGQLQIAKINAGIQKLHHYFSADTEASLSRDLIKKISAI